MAISTGTPPAARTDLNNVKAASGFNIIAGIWLILASFVLGYAAVEAALWDEIVVGAIVLVLAAVRVGNPARFPGLSWANLIAGLWLIAAPFVCGYADIGRAMWNDIIVGIVIAALAASSASMTNSFRRYHGHRMQGDAVHAGGTAPPRPTV